MAKLEAESVDAIVTDPPAGIAFMGREWDKDRGGRDKWIAWMQSVACECLRVIKPGGHALVWSIPRTSHWTAMAWENAGWQPRDRIAHCFGSGFPKSLSIDKAIDKAAGAKRGVIGIVSGMGKQNPEWNGTAAGRAENSFKPEYEATAPATDAAKQWAGWGTALKPAIEDWWLFRKPVEGTVAGNVVKHGTGGLNIDGCRVGAEEMLSGGGKGYSSQQEKNKEHGYRPYKAGLPHERAEQTAEVKLGRFPANIIHDGSDEVVGLFPQTNATKAHGGKGEKLDTRGQGWGFRRLPCLLQDNGGSAARFFYCAKASKRDRDEGCEGLPLGAPPASARSTPAEGRKNALGNPRRNHHPTVKPTALMQYLCRLITPPNGVVLDPFMGSGSTGKAAIIEGFRFIGIEQDAEYCEIARRRIAHAAAQLPLLARGEGKGEDDV